MDLEKNITEKKLKPEEIEERLRIGQPKGFSKDNHSEGSVMFYHCYNHDYVYYPENWIDEEDEVRNLKGYYDENGEYYKNIVFSKNGVFECDVTCHNCEKTNHIFWSTEAIPNCPECNETFAEEINLIEKDEIIYKEERKEKKVTKNENKGIIVLCVILGIVVLLVILGLLGWKFLWPLIFIQ